MIVGDKEVNVLTIIDKVKGNEDEEIKKAEYDYLEDCIGATGLWQLCVSSTAVLARYIALGNMLTFVFLTSTTDFTCVEFPNNVTIPVENNTCYDNCAKYVYHSDAMMTTLISDFGLVCEKKWLASFTQTILILGVLVGGVIFGWVSDRYGRRVALISSTLLNVITMIPTSFAPDYWTFTCLRFGTGFASGGSLIVCVPLVIEIIGKSYREHAGAILVLPDGFGESVLVLYAYFLPTWSMFLLGLSVSATLMSLLICFVPESPRWLISQGKVDQALIAIIGAAKVNKCNTEHIRDTVIKSIELIKIRDKITAKVSYLDFFKNRDMIILTIPTLVVSFVNSLSYYGLYQYMTLLEDNVHITVALLGMMQIPVSGLQLVLTKIFKRRISLIGSLLINGLMMIVVIFTPLGHWSTTLSGVVGFSATAFSCGIIILYQSELFPTPLRNMSFGLSSITSKIGGMVAPFIATLLPLWLPSLIFCILSVVAAGFCLLLPETKGKNLKDNVD